MLVVACSAGEPGPGVDVDRAMTHVEALTAAGPRPGDSAEARQAAAYIEQQLAAFGVVVERVPVGEVLLPEIVVAGRRFRDAHRVVTTDPDLVVRFGPPERALLVMAHYDTVRTSPGAVDNAAAVALLIELARALHEHPPAQAIMLAFTANEEVGLAGAEALAQRGDAVSIAIALDLVGGSGRLSLNGASMLIGDTELHWLADAADRAGVALDAPLPHRVVSRWWPQAERADHGAFTRRGIRAFHLYDRGQDGRWIDLAYHHASDVAARVHRGSLDELGRLLRALVAIGPPAHDGDGFWLPLATNLVVPRWCLLAFELALVFVALFGLGVFALAPSTGHTARGCGLWAALACFAISGALVYAGERLAAHDRLSPWLFTPLRSVIAEALVLVGVFGLATRAVTRLAPWIGARRYLALAILLPLASGVLLIAIGAAELAWIWLVPAAALAIAPRLGRWSPIAICVALVPCILVLRPNQMVEAAYNGFLPSGVPLVVWIASLGLPWLAGAGWWWRSHRTESPLVTLILSVGCGLSVVAGAALMVSAPIACSAAKLEPFPPVCLRGPSWP